MHTGQFRGQGRGRLARWRRGRTHGRSADNLTVKADNCNHRRYVPGLLSKIATGAADPTTVLTQQEGTPAVLDAYEAFDRHEPGWTKVALEVGG